MRAIERIKLKISAERQKGALMIQKRKWNDVITGSGVRLVAILGVLTCSVNARAQSTVPGQWRSIGPAHVTAPALPDNKPPLGEYNAVGRLTTIAIHPTNSQIIYVGSPGELGREGCGIWKTTNGGGTWQPVGDSLPTLAVAAIALDPTDPERVFIATADEGIFRSDNGGNTWANLSGPLPVRTNTTEGDRTALLINPENHDVLYLSANSGVLRSTDGGVTWPISLNGQVTNLVMDPVNPNVLYAGVLGRGVFRTSDGGVVRNRSWSSQTQSPLPASIPSIRGPLLALSHPIGDTSETVYALYPISPTRSGDPSWELFRTTDGRSWSSLFSCTSGSNGCLFFVVSADPTNNNLVFLAGPQLFISEIGRTPFTRVPAVENDRQPASPHGDYWELTFDRNDSANVFAGTDGGIYRSSNHGQTGSWSFIGHGITNVEMYDIAQAATDPNRLIAGTQDNGNVLYSGSEVWDHFPESQIQGGDGAAVAIDPTDANIMYFMAGQKQDSLKQVAGSSFFRFIQPFSFGLPSLATMSCAMFNSTFFLQVHPTVPTTLLASCGSLFRTTTNSPPGFWTAFFKTTAGHVVRSAIDAASNLYYAGTDTGTLFAVPADGSEPQRVFGNASPQNVSDIEVDPAHQDVIYVSFAPPFHINRPCADPANAGQGRIFQVRRNAPMPNATFSVTDITGNLQSTTLCVNALAVDPHTTSTLYAGTNRGVYRGHSNAIGGPWTWEAYNNGMPPADVRDLEVHPLTGHIDAATYGRGAFEVVPEAATDLAFVRITISPGPVVVGTQLIYNFEFVNSGPSIARNIIITATLPPAVTFVSAEGCPETHGTVTCGFGNFGIGSGTHFALRVVVTPNVAGAITATAAVTSSNIDLNPNNNAGSITTIVIADEADVAVISLNASPEPVKIGTPLRYAPTFVNNGPGIVTDLMFMIRLPADVTFGSAGPGCDFSAASRTVTCHLFGALQPGTNVGGLEIFVTPNVLGRINTAVRAKASIRDPNPLNNVGHAVTRVVK
ncbi:MAG: hypothetical protein ABJA98_26950 [Acidobacteriota bacterium]